MPAKLSDTVKFNGKVLTVREAIDQGARVERGEVYFPGHGWRIKNMLKQDNKMMYVTIGVLRYALRKGKGEVRRPLMCVERARF